MVIKGSRVFKAKWRRSEAVAAPAGSAIWQAPLAAALFDGYNPFNIDNVTEAQFAAMSWATPLRGKTPFTLPRGLVFQEGQWLRQAAAPAELLTGAGAYWVDRTK